MKSTIKHMLNLTMAATVAVTFASTDMSVAQAAQKKSKKSKAKTTEVAPTTDTHTTAPAATTDTSSAPASEPAAAPAVSHDTMGETANQRFWIGGLVGIEIPSGDAVKGLKTRLGYGGTVGYKLTDMFGVGGYYTRSKGDYENTTVSATRQSFGGELDAFFEQVPGLNAGIRVGAYTLSSDIPGIPTVTLTGFTFGPRVGYDYKLPFGLSVGIDAAAMFDAGAKKDMTIPGVAEPVTVKVGAHQAYDVFAAIKYWL